MNILIVIGIILFAAGLLIFLSSSVFSRKVRKKKREIIGLVVGILGMFITILAWRFPLPAKLQKETEQRLFQFEKEAKEANENIKRIESHLGIPIYVDGLPSADSSVFNPFVKGLKLMTGYKWEDAIAEFKQSMKEAKASQLVALYSFIGLCYLIGGNIDLALDSYNKSLMLAREFNDRKGEVSALEYLSLIYQERGDFEKALQYYEDALKIYRETGNKKREAEILGIVGSIFRIRGDVDMALKYLGESLNISREIGDKDKEGMYQVLIDLTNGDLDKALKYFDSTSEITKEIGNKQDIVIPPKVILPFDLVQIIVKSSIISLTKENPEKAFEYIVKEIGNKNKQAEVLVWDGEISEIKGDLDEALKYYEKALKIYKEIGYRRGEANTLSHFGLLYNFRGEMSKALRYYEKALKIFIQIGAQREIEQTKENIKRLKDE